MKKKLLVILCVFLAFVFLASCKVQYTLPVSNLQIVKFDGNVGALVDLTESSMNQIIEALQFGEWEDALQLHHDYDVEFEIGEEKIQMRYHSSCGRFFDMTNNRTLMLSDADREKINTMLGVPLDFNESEYDAEVKIIQYYWSGGGLETKTIDGEMAYYIIDELKKLETTGEKVAALSDEWIDLDDKLGESIDLDTDGGTKWIRLGENYYRIDPDISEICLVDGYLGEGERLNASEELLEKIGEAWYYHPYCYYSGSYENGELKISNLYAAETNVEVSVQEININTEQKDKNTIKLELISSVDGEFKVKLDSRHSDDFLGIGDSKTVELKKNEATEIELSFSGFNFQYYIYIVVDNTKIMIRINP